MKIATAVLLLVAALMGGQTHAAPVIQATLTMGNNTGGLGIDVATRKVFVSNYNDGTLTVVHADTLAVLGTVPAGTHPRRLIVNSASNLVYVVNDNAPGTVTVVETGSYGIVATIPVGNNPRTLGADFGAREVYVANHTGNSVSIIDTATNSVLATVPVGNGPRSPVANSGLGKVYVPNYNDASVSVIDTLTRTVTKTIPVGSGPQYAAVDAAHDKVYVNNVADRTISVIDSATDSVIKTLPSGAGSDDNFGNVNHAYGRYYLANSVDNTVTIVDTDTDTVAGTVPVGTKPIQIQTDLNGGNVYVVNQGSHSVSVLDATTEAVLTSYAVGTGPWRILIDDNHVYVLNGNGTNPDTMTVSTRQDTLANTHAAVEWYHEAFDHYFHTASALENQVINDGAYAPGLESHVRILPRLDRPGRRTPVGQPLLQHAVGDQEQPLLHRGEERARPARRRHHHGLAARGRRHLLHRTRRPDDRRLPGGHGAALPDVQQHAGRRPQPSLHRKRRDARPDGGAGLGRGRLGAGRRVRVHAASVTRRNRRGDRAARGVGRETPADRAAAEPLVGRSADGRAARRGGRLARSKAPPTPRVASDHGRTTAGGRQEGRRGTLTIM